MKNFPAFLLTALPIFLSASLATAGGTVAPAPEGAGATTIYRQVMPDGRIVYSDTLAKGAKVDRILLVPRAENKTAAKSMSGEQTKGGGKAGTTAGSGKSEQ